MDQETCDKGEDLLGTILGVLVLLAILIGFVYVIHHV